MNQTESIPVHNRRLQHVTLTVLFAVVLAACGKSPGGPTPPQAPPRPQVSAGVATHVHPAVFSYTGQRRMEFQYQDPTGPKTPKLVIQT